MIEGGLRWAAFSGASSPLGRAAMRGHRRSQCTQRGELAAIAKAAREQLTGDLVFALGQGSLILTKINDTELA